MCNFHFCFLFTFFCTIPLYFTSAFSPPGGCNFFFSQSHIFSTFPSRGKTSKKSLDFRACQRLSPNSRPLLLLLFFLYLFYLSYLCRISIFPLRRLRVRRGAPADGVILSVFYIYSCISFTYIYLYYCLIGGSL